VAARRLIRRGGAAGTRGGSWQRHSVSSEVLLVKGFEVDCRDRYSVVAVDVVFQRSHPPPVQEVELEVSDDPLAGFVDHAISW